MVASRRNWIGVHFPPIEDKRFVLGKGRYVNDIVLPGMLHLATVASPHAHAIINSIDASRAEQAPGVVKVIVGEELPEWMESIARCAHRHQCEYSPAHTGRRRRR